jgi:two-component system sensor histidine kinase/response regulator
MAGPFYHLITAVKHRWSVLAGSPSQFTLEARIFHSISLGIALLTLIYIPYNLFAGLYVAALSCLICGGIFFYEYYRSRFLFQAHRSLLFGITGLLILSVNYFANSGLEGSTDLIWPVYLLLLLTICAYRHMITWVIVYLFVFGLVHVIEYQYPELVQYPFQAGNGQFTDRITAFPLPVIGIAIIVGMFRRNYDKERAAVAQRDAEKSRLLSILSHDLRAPFIQVQQYFELLDDDTLSQADRLHIERELKHANNQTLELVTNLLYWSRSQLEGFSIHLTILLLAETLKDTLEMAARLSGEKRITLTTNIHPELRIMADADMLQLVMRNLLQNAIKFTPSGGIISVESVIKDDSCRISVNDNGIGIAPMHISHLFSGTITALGTAKERGVGLGLQLCKEFVESQGGSIHVESVQGKGSRFTINIPLA